MVGTEVSQLQLYKSSTEKPYHRKEKCDPFNVKSYSNHLYYTSVIASWICLVSFSIISSMHLLVSSHFITIHLLNFMISTIMKLLFFIIFSFAFVDLGVCLDKYLNCSTQTFKCGLDLDNIGFPFWGKSKPEYCGLPDFELSCDEIIPYILFPAISDNIRYRERYRVLKIDQQNKIMRIVNSYFFDEDGCSWSSDNYATRLDFRLFKYTERVVNITLFTSCDFSISSSYEFANEFICNSTHTIGFFAKTQSLIKIPHQKLPRCNYSVTVPVMETNLDGTIFSGTGLSDVLRAGFEVSYGFTEDISNCKICEMSGGECGYEKRFNQTTCFCPEGRSMRTRNGATQRCAQVSGRGHLEKKIMIGTTGAISTILVLLLVVLVFLLRKKQRETRNDQRILEAFYKNQESLALKRYKYFDVKKMTNSFKEKLGQGGYGSVFKGKLHDGHPVAVKLLFTNSKNNGEEFINEVESISRTSHVNVVNLLGFCLEGKKRALIYEFMANGSLEKFIYNKKPPLTLEDHHPQLGGDTLFQIAIGIARGLEYLHRGCNTRILHFDIKPHNILLDEKFCPKIADFGLAKLCTRNESMISFLGARGTTGYIAPEVFSRNFGGVSYKSDVYSYGMMILEMVGGRKNIDVGIGMDHSSQLYYPHWIYERLKQNEDLGLQGVIMTEANEEIARKMIIVGLWCIQTNPTNRPSMTKVLEMLEGRKETLMIPPKPFLSSPSRSSPMSSPTAVLMSTNYSPSGSQPASSSTVVSISI